MDTAIDGNKNEQLVTAEWVATKMGIPVPSIYDYSRRGVLPCVRVGKLVRYRPSAIQDFIDQGGKR